jgi:hypothetical protein
LAGTVLAVVACSDGLNPFVPGEVYVLRSIGGDPLPAVAGQFGSITLLVLADTLRLLPNGAGVRAQVEVQDFATDEVLLRDLVPRRSSFTYLRTGDRIEFTLACPPEASCVAGPNMVGLLEGNILEVELDPPRRGPQVYELVKN